jgi:butyryl-CoA dehydrogenase
MLQETVRDFAERECRPHAAVWDREARLPDARVLDQMFEMGLLGMCLPEAYGGGGQELLAAILCIEQLARISPLCAAGVFESNVGPVRVIERFGTEEQRKRVLPQVCRGEMQISVGMTEAEAGSALTDLRTRAEPDPGGWRLNGRKVFCSGGGHSEAYLVYCRFGDAPGAKGIGALLVEKCWWRRARRASRSASRSSTWGCAACPAPTSCSRTASCPRRTSWLRRAASGR